MNKLSNIAINSPLETPAKPNLPLRASLLFRIQSFSKQTGDSSIRNGATICAQEKRHGTRTSKSLPLKSLLMRSIFFAFSRSSKFVSPIMYLSQLL